MTPITGTGCCARPRRPAAEQRDELAPPHHSITSSERASSVGGTSMPTGFDAAEMPGGLITGHCARIRLHHGGDTAEGTLKQLFSAK